MKKSLAELFFVHFHLTRRVFRSAHVESLLSDEKNLLMLRLKELGGCNLKTLSNNMLCSSSNLCIMLNKLYEDEFVTRKEDSKDRRNVIYELTEKGYNFVSEIKLKKIESIDKLLEKLDDKEKQDLYNAIEIAGNIIEKCVK